MKKLPVALQSFHIQNFKGIKDTKVENIPLDTRWIFLTGENGFGKTSVLQAIANGLTLDNIISNSKFIDGGVVINIFYVKEKKEWKNRIVHIKFKILGEVTETGLLVPTQANLKKNINQSLEGFLTAYGSTRLRISAGDSKETAEKYSPIDSLFSNETLLIDTENRLKDWFENYKEGFKELESLFVKLLPQLVKINIEFDQNTKKSEVKYYEKDIEGKSYKNGVTFLELAAGYKNIIAMIGDMVYRLSAKQDVKNLSDLEGIVIIDEFELHLHPKYQKLFVEKLTELFPKIQFIVSTHSPIPLLGAPKKTVIINVNRTDEEGITAKILDIDFQNLTPNEILTSPIFGFQELIPESHDTTKFIISETNFQDRQTAQKINKDISNFLTPDKTQELLQLIKQK